MSDTYHTPPDSILSMEDIREEREQSEIEKGEQRREDRELVSECCGAHIFNTDYDICPECKEHCEFTEV